MTGGDPLSHFNSEGQAHMVDVGDKPVSRRRAIAEGRIRLSPETLARIREGEVGKGDVLGVARIAGIQGAKQTGSLIPLCHPLPLTGVEVEPVSEEAPPAVRVTATTETEGRTGVEMEALTAVSTALLTIYDMCKAMDRGMELEGVRLLEKSGGQSGLWRRANADGPGDHG